jgi:O-antigen/teichoic acid export membrane protein
MLTAADKYDEAKVVLRSTWVFLFLVCVGLSVAVIASALLIDWSHLLSLKNISRPEAGWSLIALGLMVVFSLPGSIIGGLYRAGHRNARGVAMASTSRLAQLGAIVLVAPLTKSLALVAFALMTVQILALVFQLIDVRRYVLTLGIFGSRLDWGELTAMWRPSLSFMLFPIANALYFQGVRCAAEAAFFYALIRRLFRSGNLTLRS